MNEKKVRMKIIITIAGLTENFFVEISI